jgi:hypothetical protein
MPSIKRVIFRALLQHRALSDIIADLELSFDGDWAKGLVILDELQARVYLEDRDREILRKLVSEIVACHATLSTEGKRRADIALRRITPLLLTEERKRMGLQLITHRRKGHRRAGYAALSGLVDLTIITALLKDFESHGDIGALECIARSDNEYTISAHAEYILDLLGGDYLKDSWRTYLKARIFQRLLGEVPAEAIRLSSKDELAFVWGAGRAQAHVALETILKILSRNRNNYEVLGLIAWALGRLGAVGALEKLSHELGL